MKDKKYNRLIKEKSPYLREHADNPVDWYPWGEEAFEKAKKEDKLIFLSIGYSSCHWCHVMEEESFMDEEVAGILNRYFVSIKVDREERPDIDKVYIDLCYMLTGNAGWPLTIIMTPDKKPFFAATYIPKTSRFGMKGLLELLPEIVYIWKTKREEIERVADEVQRALLGGESYIFEKFKGNYEIKEKEIFEKAFNYFEENFDSLYGGFGTQPKFPSPHNLMFLLRYYDLKKNSFSLKMVEKTLKRMRMGGIYDHIDGGFHRYSTDKYFKVPHFEKMLYDQAMLISIYTETYQVTKDSFYLETATEIANFLKDNMLSKEGGFHSSFDADVGGEEGKFYLWKYQELKNLLDEEEFKFLSEYFEIKKEGNFEDKTVLYQIKDFDKQSKVKWKKIRKKLKSIRDKREKPFRDEKILTDWNSLLIYSLLKPGKVSENKEFIYMAKRCADFILDNLYKEGVLYHLYFEGEAKVKGFLDDYSFFILALTELYETTFEFKYLEFAKNLTDYVIENFFDKDKKVFYQTTLNRELPVRKIDLYDNAYPSGNSVMFQSLLNLYFIFQEEKYIEIFEKSLKTIYGHIYEVPQAFISLLSSLYVYIKKPIEIVIAGNINDAIFLSKKLNENFLPYVYLIHIDDKEVKSIFKFASDYSKINNKTTYYVCRDFICNFPVNDLKKVFKIIGLE